MTVCQSETFLARGSVVRVTLRNFMTYVNETFWPGPNFNVVVGANGSGKSSIVTALCICLGGELKFLNRQSDLSSLVNNSSSSSEAQVEVELFDPNDDNIRFCSTNCSVLIMVFPGWDQASEWGCFTQRQGRQARTSLWQEPKCEGKF